ncbi:hypothetical protein DM56_4463 [Burkholderia mallei]|nr:hypothetical protein DM56_4463 [Burkholderia mallei]KOT16372.1 hypothetical protein DM47_2391 [Burkholderia mallei]
MHDGHETQCAAAKPFGGRLSYSLGGSEFVGGKVRGV